MQPDPQDIVTLHAQAEDGTKIEIDMPRWVREAIYRGEVPVWRGTGDPVLRMEEQGKLTRWYPFEG
jgi:hypothetical protein